ncbi:MAG: hypothetical protein Q9M37_05940 [Desulfonauticus sp.]|nr:hypothetical protein [Desulfonauticus sp.]
MIYGFVPVNFTEREMEEFYYFLEGLYQKEEENEPEKIKKNNRILCRSWIVFQAPRGRYFCVHIYK